MAYGLDRLLKLRLRALNGDAGEEAGGTAYFLVVVDDGSPEEARDWLSGLVRGKGRVVAVEELDPGPEAKTKPGPVSSGVGPEEKNLLWSKP